MTGVEPNTIGTLDLSEDGERTVEELTCFTNIERSNPVMVSNSPYKQW